MLSSIVTGLGFCTVLSTVCVLSLVAGEDILASTAANLPSQNAQLLEACFNLCQQGMCPSSCPQSFVGPWSKRSYRKRTPFDKGGYGTGFDDHGWFMRLLGRMN
ncbi:uncharacterized protein LOC111103613 [Crassostrea virginica]